MTFDPKTNKFPYPEITNQHYLHVLKDDGTVFDRNYPYVDKSKKMRFKQFWMRVALYLIAFPLTRIRLNLKIRGRKNLRKHKAELKQGVVSICNHVHMWDYLGVMCALKPYHTYEISWDKNISGENGKLIRLVGGIPLPIDNPLALAKCFNEINKHLKSGGWLHVYPEGSMWEFYQPIRPFKEGAAYFAVKNNKPIIPLGYSYRPNGWIRRVLFKSPASFTLNIGEPIYPDTTLEEKEAIIKLTIEARNAMCKLCGIDPNENIYPPIFDNNKRIDYYTSEYGVGYKKSW